MRREIHAGFWWGNLKEREHLEDISVDGWMMLKMDLKGWVERGLDCSGS
jgi:hypothetical protein